MLIAQVGFLGEDSASYLTGARSNSVIHSIRFAGAASSPSVAASNPTIPFPPSDECCDLT